MVKLWRVKGFTMVEPMIVMAILSFATFTMVSMIRPMEYRLADQQTSLALYAQSLSMIDANRYDVPIVDGCNVDQWFYHPGGTVNQANTFYCDHHSLIVHLGSGNIEIERLY